MLPQRLLGRDLFWWLTRLGFMRVNTATRDSAAACRPGRVRHRHQPPPAQAGRRPVPSRAWSTPQGRTARFADDSSRRRPVVVWATGYRSDYSWISIPGVLPTAVSCTGAGSPTYPGCTSSACPGSTPAAPRCSGSSPTTRPTSPSGSPPAQSHSSNPGPGCAPAAIRDGGTDPMDERLRLAKCGLAAHLRHRRSQLPGWLATTIATGCRTSSSSPSHGDGDLSSYLAFDQVARMAVATSLRGMSGR